MTKLFGSNGDAAAPLFDVNYGIGLGDNGLLPVETGASGDATSFEILTTTVLLAGDMTTQEPAAVDTPIQLKFGAPQTTAHWDLDALGNITCVTPGNYNFLLRVQWGRSGNMGAARLVVRFLVNGFQVGNPVYTTIDQSADVKTGTFEGSAAAEIGDVITIEFYRDSTGSDDGGVFPFVTTLGWGTAPSAQMLITESTVLQN